MDDPIITLATKVALGEVGQELAAARPPQNMNHSAVLALFTDDPAYSDDDATSVVLLQRHHAMRRHAGQVAFPGGLLDAGETVVEAVLRETWEETGIDPQSIRIFGQLPTTHIPVSGYDVTPLVGWCSNPVHAAVSPQEVSATYLVPVRALVDPDQRSTAVTPTGFHTPAFEPLAPGLPRLFIWGFTAFVLDILLTAAGWEQPWDITKQQPVPTHLLGASTA